MKNNNQLVYTGALLAATLAFGQVTQAAPLILGGNQTISTDTAVESVVIGNTGAGPTGGDGSLTVNNGATLINSGNGTFIGNIGGVNPQRGHGYIGLNAGSTGVATITGANSLWQNQSVLSVGFRGQGTLNIADGGKVTSTQGYLGNNAGSTGDVTVTGTGSLWESSTVLSVNRGTLNIENGGKVINTSGTIGASSTSTSTSTSADTATVTVTGQNSLWQNSTTLHVSGRGQGTLNVQDGGKVTNTVGYIGAGTDQIGAATVTGANSLWQNSSVLNVGANGGQGTLNIQDGGKVTSTNGFIGYTGGATGITTVNLSSG